MREHGELHAAIADAIRDECWSDIARLLSRVDDTSLAAAILRDTAADDVLHRVRQEHLRLRDPDFVDSEPCTRRARRVVSELRANGITRIRGLLPRRHLRRIAREIDTAITEMEPIGFHHYDQRQYWREDQQAFVFNDGLAFSQELTTVCRHPLLVEAANHYLGKVANIKRVYGMRYLPKDQPDTHQFGWHHDMEDRMVKVMLLLTDVTAADQFMTYVAGTQDELHPYECFLRNTLSFEQIGADQETAREVHTIGRAGDVFLFDPNGMHRGRRSMGAVRDAIFIEFTADGNRGNIWGSELGVARPEWFGSSAADPLREFRDLTPKWVRNELSPRTQTTWAESLPDPEVWLRTSAAKVPAS